MRKHIVYGLAILLVILGLAACGKKESKEENNSSHTPVENSSQEKSDGSSLPKINVDFGESLGEIKAINGINNGPKAGYSEEGGEISWNLDVTEVYKDLAIPLVRTHDMEYPYGGERFIDVHCIFPDFDADVDDPDSYHFEETDLYVENIHNAGAEVFYRLGESIGLVEETEAKYTNPPADYEKWAAICSHIISHYTRGWKNGFQYNMTYWEIWNEPDMKRQWNADVEEYYEFYKVTSRILKAEYPEIKIGAVIASANEEPMEAMVKGITDDGQETPMDFFDCHLYSNNPRGFSNRGKVVREVLDRYGYEKTEIFMGEWNYVDDWNQMDSTWKAIVSPEIASFYTACLIEMQNSCLDGALYYDGTLIRDIAQWCGLYDAQGNLLPGYCAFRAFALMKNLGYQYPVRAEESLYANGLYVLAAGNGEDQGILLANIGDQGKTFQLNIHGADVDGSCTAFYQDKEHPMGAEAEISLESGSTTVEMGPYQMAYILWTK